jgi:phosphate transport system substrate-binding protein
VKANKWIALALALVAVVALVGCGTGAKTADQTSGGTTTELTGAINVAGSDTMVNVAQAWAEKFSTANPGVMVTVKGGGSGTGIAALINGTVDFADASREIKPEETTAAQGKGVNPVATAVANDGISVVVNPANKVTDLSIEQLGKIYRGEITNWKDVGGADAPIVLLGRDTSSGTYEFFGETVVGKDAQYAKSMRNLQSNQAIIDEVSKNVNAVGYVGLGYAQSAGTSVKRLTLGGIEDTVDNVLSAAYPLSRKLYMISNGQPEGAKKAYLDWILSAEGQALVQEQGFVPLAK